MTTASQKIGIKPEEIKKYFSKQNPHGILFSILSCRCDFAHFSYPKAHSCHGERLVCLKNPHTTCYAAFGVLVKTIDFIKSLPSFQNLPLNDRIILLQNRWVPLFLLGLAQEHFTFEVWDFPAASILRNILLNGQQKSDDCPPTLAEVYKLKMFLNKVWSLDLSLNEYAYLKSAILFSQGEIFLKRNARAWFDIASEKEVRLIKLNVHLECTANLDSVYFLKTVLLNTLEYTFKIIRI